MRPFAPILMGSISDLKHAQAISKALGRFGIDAELRVASAHKTPARLLEIIKGYDSDPRAKVFITVAGRSNALSGVVDAQVAAPVIACPPPSEAFAGADVFSSIRMPSGVAPALVLDPDGAGLAAAKILALAADDVRALVAEFQRLNAERLEEDDARVQSAAVEGSFSNGSVK